LLPNSKSIKRRKKQLKKVDEAASQSLKGFFSRTLKFHLRQMLQNILAALTIFN
jgi:hypothetical protein